MRGPFGSEFAPGLGLIDRLSRSRFCGPLPRGQAMGRFYLLAPVPARMVGARGPMSEVVMQTTIETNPRNDLGKGPARRARMKGQVPAVIYGSGASTLHVALDPGALEAIFSESKDRNTVVYAKVGDEQLPCLVGEVQRHPVSRAIEHVDLCRVSKERPVVVSVPVNAVGRPKGAAAGGRLRLVRRDLKVSCVYDRIPKSIDVDVSDLDAGDSLLASSVTLGEGVSLVLEQDFDLFQMIGKKTDAAG